jgi:hypothetical protein
MDAFTGSRGREVAATTTQHPIERSVARFLAAARDGDTNVFCTPSDADGTLDGVVAAEEALEGGSTVPVDSFQSATTRRSP